MLCYLAKLAVIGACLMVATASGVLAEDVPNKLPKKLDAREAQQLLYKVLSDHAIRPRPPGTLEPEEAINPPFFSFSGFGIIDSIDGVWSINPWTGDIWDLWACRRLKGHILHKALAEIRQRFTPEEMKQYPKLRTLKPACTTD